MLHIFLLGRNYYRRNPKLGIKEQVSTNWYLSGSEKRRSDLLKPLVILSIDNGRKNPNFLLFLSWILGRE
jgi:hypothetical protein